MKNTVIHLSQDCPRTGHVPGRGQDEDKRGQKKFHCQNYVIFQYHLLNFNIKLI